MSGLTTNLLEGLAAKLEAAHVGDYSSGTAYAPAASLAAITLYKMPEGAPKGPDRVICLSAYPVDDALGAPNSTVGLQVRTRWNGKDPRGTDDLDDAVFGVLQQFKGTLSTGVRVAFCRRVSGVSLGQDEGGRWLRSSNYYVSAYWPTSHRV